MLTYTSGRQTTNIARKLLARKEVVYVGASIGEPTIDMCTEAVIKDNEQLLGLLETIKAIPNVKNVIWREIVKIVGRRSSVPDFIIDQPQAKLFDLIAIVDCASYVVAICGGF